MAGPSLGGSVCVCCNADKAKRSVHIVLFSCVNHQGGNNRSAAAFRMRREGFWSAQRWVQSAPTVGPRGSKTAPRRTKTGLGRLKEVSWWLKNTSKPLSETSKIGFSLDTSIKNQCFNKRLLNHTCVTSCRCLKVLQSVLKASRYPPGRLSKASWSLHESTKMGFSCDTSFKNRLLNNMLPKHRLVTSDWCLEALWSASKASWSHVGPSRKASWTLQNLPSAGQRPSKQSKMSFQGVQKTIFMDMSNGKHFLRMYCTKALLLMLSKGSELLILA